MADLNTDSIANSAGTGAPTLDNGINATTASLIKIAHSEVARFTSSGLSFDGGTNFLGDYEEDVWTPIAGSGLSFTHTNSKYTKIGNLITLTSQLSSVTGSTSNTFEITNLPYQPLVSITAGNLFCASGTYPISNPTCYVSTASKITIYKPDQVSGTNTQYLANQFNSASIQFSITYLTL